MTYPDDLRTRLVNAQGLEALRVEFRESGLDLRDSAWIRPHPWQFLISRNSVSGKRPHGALEGTSSRALVKHLVETPRELFQDPAVSDDRNQGRRHECGLCSRGRTAHRFEHSGALLQANRSFFKAPPGSGRAKPSPTSWRTQCFEAKKVTLRGRGSSRPFKKCRNAWRRCNSGSSCLVLHDSGSKPGSSGTTERRTRPRPNDRRERLPTVRGRIRKPLPINLARTAAMFTAATTPVSVSPRRTTGISADLKGRADRRPPVIPRNRPEHHRYAPAERYAIDDLTRIARGKSPTTRGHSLVTSISETIGQAEPASSPNSCLGAELSASATSRLGDAFSSRRSGH